RKAELLKEERELAQQKADLERREFVADALVKEQMNEVERCINGRFRLVRFRMYSPQLNGGEKPDCVMLSRTDGAKYMDMNSAQKINAGLDIINALCAFHGVCAPVFIDNAEGVNEFIPAVPQLVKLAVTNDRQLVIKNNN
ncbi:MAG: hypothetical protein LBK96_06345, partial [Prevotellaceae bacterium]|nr:hypothetical protein [Prevotellaceae bacterium]